MSQSQSRVRLRKSAARELLMDRDLTAYRKWAAEDGQVLRTLASLLFEADDLLRWRAIEALGIAAKQVATADPESVQRALRRLFWLMNDESGGICWCAPEAVAEILFNCPNLIPDYGKLLASYLVEEPFEAGARWALGRIGHLNRDEFAHVQESLLLSLVDDVPEMRAYSYLALRALKVEVPVDHLDKLRQDSAPVPLYDFATGELHEPFVSDIIK